MCPYIFLEVAIEGSRNRAYELVVYRCTVFVQGKLRSDFEEAVGIIEVQGDPARRWSSRGRIESIAVTEASPSRRRD